MMEKWKKLPVTTPRVIRWILWGVGIFIGLVCSQFDWVPGMVVGLALMLAGFLWHALFLRCPHCHTMFHIRQPIPKYCPNCGKHIL